MCLVRTAAAAWYACGFPSPTEEFVVQFHLFKHLPSTLGDGRPFLKRCIPFAAGCLLLLLFLDPAVEQAQGCSINTIAAENAAVCGPCQHNARCLDRLVCGHQVAVGKTEAHCDAIVGRCYIHKLLNHQQTK